MNSIPIRLDWTPAQLASLQERAWATFISYSASLRRIFSREYADACSTVLARHEAKPQAVSVTPDAYFAPDQRPYVRRHGSRGWRWI